MVVIVDLSDFLNYKFIIMVFTIVTVCYNAAGCIRHTIKSVLSQQRNLFEYIIIDGASKDNTLSIINEFREQIDIVVSEPDNGVYDAMNKAISLAHGEYINFMNAGDFFVNSHILQDIASRIDGKRPDVVFGHEIEKLDGVYYQIEAAPFYEPPYIKHSMGFNHQSCFVKTLTAKQFPFDLKYKLAADYNMIMTIYRNKGSFQKIDVAVSYFDVSGLSSSHKFAHECEVYDIERPSSPIRNYIETRCHAVIRSIRFIIQPIATALFPSFMEHMRKLKRRYTKIEFSYDS